jgi:hypothetical protein
MKKVLRLPHSGLYPRQFDDTRVKEGVQRGFGKHQSLARENRQRKQTLGRDGAAGVLAGTAAVRHGDGHFPNSTPGVPF